MMRVVEQATALGLVIGLVDVVGIAMIRPLQELSDSNLDRQFDVTVRHAFLALQLGGARDRRGGRRQYGVDRVDLKAHDAGGETAYGAAKAALHRLVSSAARELGRERVRANVLAPGFTRPRLNQLLREAQWPQAAADIPRGEAGKPAEIAAAVLFLISDLSSYINRQVITADGGAAGSIRVPF